MLPDMDSLALFVRAAELRSLTRAAEASHIGLAAASRRIALLEHRFKTALLERSSRGVELTAAGAALLPHAKALLVAINQMQAEMSDHADGRKGALRILANPSVMTESFPEDIAGFARCNPEVRLVLEERWSDEIVRVLQAAEADLGIAVEGLRADGLETIPYSTDRLSVVMPPAHRLARQPQMAFADVLEDDLIVLEGSAAMQLFAAQAAIAELALRFRVQARSFEAICRMVQAGLGLGIVPFHIARVLGQGLKLSVRPLAEAWAQRRMLIYVKKERMANNSVARLLEHLTRPRDPAA